MHRALAMLLVAIILAPPAVAQVQQSAPGRILCTTGSDNARASFDLAQFHAMNSHNVRAAAHALDALAADPNLGIARAYWVWANPTLSPAQRQLELDRAVTDAAAASPTERLVASLLRAAVLNRVQERDALIDSLTTVMPDDPIPTAFKAFYMKNVEDRVAYLETLAWRYPTFAPARNLLAWGRFALADRDGAFAAAKDYVRLLPDHPNTHYTLALLNQQSGRLPDALAEFRRVHELDPMFGPGFGAQGMANVLMLMGKARDARESYLKSAALATSPVDAQNRRAFAAYTLLMDGNPGDAVRELVVLSTEAEKGGMDALAAAWSRSAGLVEALFGDPQQVAPNLAKWAAVVGDDPAQLRYTAIAYAVIGRLDLARPAADRLRQMKGHGNIAGENVTREVDGVIAVAMKDYPKAMNELSLAGPSATLGRAILADALARTGRKAEARGLEAEITNTFTMSAFDAMARARVRKL